MTLCSAEQIRLGYFDRRPFKKHLCEIILNLDQWFRRYHLKVFSLFNICFQRGSYKVWEINMGVCPCLEFDITLINCLGYGFYIYGAFEFLCNSIVYL